MTQTEKQRAHGLLAERFSEQQLSVFRIEERLGLYMQKLIQEIQECLLQHGTQPGGFLGKIVYNGDSHMLASCMK